MLVYLVLELDHMSNSDRDRGRVGLQGEREGGGTQGKGAIGQ